LGERLVRNEEVRGSSPLTSTTQSKPKEAHAERPYAVLNRKILDVSVFVSVWFCVSVCVSVTRSSFAMAARCTSSDACAYRSVTRLFRITETKAQKKKPKPKLNPAG
jgi:hypothetical protein